MSNDFFYLVIDLEATCCDLQTVLRGEMETIEIGAVIVNRHTLQPVAEWQTFIRPVRHPQLTQFCTDLTSITQAEVDAAPLFPEAIANFQQWLSAYPGFLLSSWGEYDRNQLQQDCNFHGIAYPLGPWHLDLQKQFTTTQKLPQLHSMNQALKFAKLALDGTHHRGIDDAKNLAKLLPYIVGKETL